MPLLIFIFPLFPWPNIVPLSISTEPTSDILSPEDNFNVPVEPVKELLEDLMSIDPVALVEEDPL